MALIEQADDHVGTGFLSTCLLLPVLVDNGRPDLAFRLLLRTTSPSWLHQVEHGATTLWETWEGHDAAWGEAQEKDYNEHRYHNFSDNYAPEMNFEGNAKLARFGMELGWKAMEQKGPVEWLPGDEFAAARRKSEGR